MLSDLRFALRQLAKAPEFTATTVVTFALSIGACTIVWSTVCAILFDTWEEPEPERLVIIRQPPSGRSRAGDRVSLPDFLDIHQQAKSFEFIQATSEFGFRLTLTGRGEPLALPVTRICRLDYPGFSTEPMRLEMGRNFRPEEYAPGKNRVVIVSYGFWQSVLGGDANVLGQTLILNDAAHMIIGVRARSYERYGGRDKGWVPNDLTWPPRNWRNFDVMARLRAGVTLAQAQAEMNAIATRLAEQYPDTNTARDFANVTPWLDYQNRYFAAPLHVLLAAVGCVLLVACANVASLFLIRGTARQREIAVRAALGASRSRLVRQLLTESLLLAVLGGIAGVVLAEWGIEGVRAFAGTHPHQMVRLGSVQTDLGVLGAAIAMTAGAGLLAGLAPAWLVSRVDLNTSLKQGTRGSSEAGSRSRLRRVLIAFEIAGTVVLLAAAGLLVRSFARSIQLDTGYEIQRGAEIRVDLPNEKYARSEHRRAFAADLLERLRTLPGIERAALASDTAQGSSFWVGLAIEGRSFRAEDAVPKATAFAITPDYFHTLGIRLQRGRFFEEHDDAGGPRVAIINEALARTFFPGEDPLGRRIRYVSGTTPGLYDSRLHEWHEIVGVVSDVVLGLPGRTRVGNQVYTPFAQVSLPTFSAVVRTRGEPSAMFRLVTQQVFAVDKDQPVAYARTMEDRAAEDFALPRLTLYMLGAFSLLALVIAAVGIYGVMAYSVSQRTSEIGIRMALGASEGNVLREVLAEGMKLVGMGLLLGFIVALPAAFLIRAHLFQTNAYDPLTLSLVAATLAVVGLLACWLPARRAMKVDPIVALRTE